MKTLKIYPIARNILFLFLAIIMALTFDSCATKTKFARSTIVPAAEGVVSVKQDKNDNYVINVNISNLADPMYLQHPRSTYVVWMEGDDNETKNIGQIKSSNSFMSKSLKGSFETVSSVKPKKIFLTAENDPSVQYPDNTDVILTTNYLKDK
ncbi:MAG: hypothetical protein H7X84_03635 [Verrucomicrobia bacterium]|nr:hypothetical protein [Prolixibacteraceae bacterium]